MIITGTGVAFLLLVCVWLPYLAWKSAKRVGKGPLPISRERLFGQVIGTQAFIFIMAWFTARENGIVLWTAPRRPLQSWSAAALLLGAILLTLKLRWTSRSSDQKARLYSMLPHNARERVPYAGVCVAAGIAEEVVYRGVLTTLLSWYIGSLIAAAVVSAIVFGLAHMIQGPRAVIATALIGLVMQALVAFAASLLPAMVIHAAYDFIAGIVIPRWYERDATSSPLPGVVAAADR